MANCNVNRVIVFGKVSARFRIANYPKLEDIRCKEPMD